RGHSPLIGLVQHLRLVSADGFRSNRTRGSRGVCIGDLRSIGRPDRSTVTHSIEGEAGGNVAIQIENPDITTDYAGQALAVRRELNLGDLSYAAGRAQRLARA